MTGRELSRLRIDLRWLLGAPLVWCAGLAGVAAAVILGRATLALEESGQLHLALQEVAVRLAAEQAAAEFVRTEGEAVARTFAVADGITLRTRVTADDSMQDGRVVVAFDGQQVAFDFPILAGGGPRVFADPLTALVGGPELPAGWQQPVRRDVADWPNVRLEEATKVAETNLGLGLRRDRGIGLLRLQFGTELEDFLLGAGQGAVRIDVLEARFVHVHGHLWVDCGSAPLVIELDHSLTLVVEGNVYLGRSVEVVGEGQLTIVTRQGAGAAFVDADGNAVSNTYTLNWDFGSGVVVKGAGFLLNDEMDDFSAKPGVANAFGVVGSDANAIEPGKRMLSSMSPSIVTRDGKVSLVVGTPGGSRIFTSIFQVLNNIYDFHLPLEKAVAAQRVHPQLLPKDTIYYGAYAPLAGKVAEELKAMGYTLEDQGWNMGDIQAIRVDGKALETASDPRGRGVGLVVKP